MLRFLKTIISSTGMSSSGPADSDFEDFLSRATTPRYPPYREGLPVASAEQIVETQPELVAAIDRSLGFPKPEFKRLIYPVIRRYAAYAHLLPASENHHHRLAGGLFRHGLEVAKYTSRASEGIVWILGESPQERRRSEPRWRVAAFLAGLLHDVGKIISDIVVVDGDGVEWNPFESDLPTWANSRGVTRYFIHWRANRLDKHRMFFGHLRDRIMGDELAAWMHKGDPEAIGALMVLQEATRENSKLKALMEDGDSWSTKKDLSTSKADAATGSLTNLTAPQVMIRDAAQRLIANGAWKANVPGARIWVIGTPQQHEVFLVWKKATEEILDLLQSDGVTGIPSGPDLLADDLIDRGIAEPRNEFRYWPIQPDVLATNERHPVLLTLKIVTPQWLFGDTPIPEPTTAFIGTEEERVASMAAAIQSENSVREVARSNAVKASKVIGGKQAKATTKMLRTAAEKLPTRGKEPPVMNPPAEWNCPECGGIIRSAPVMGKFTCSGCGCVFDRDAEARFVLDLPPRPSPAGEDDMPVPPPTSEKDYYDCGPDHLDAEGELPAVIPAPYEGAPQQVGSDLAEPPRDDYRAEAPSDNLPPREAQESKAAIVARSMFEDSLGGRIVLKLLEHTKRKGWGAYLVLNGRDVTVPYVSALNGMKRFERKPDQKDLAPHDILKLWANLGWLEPDKYDPSRYQHEAGGSQFLKFRRHIADSIRALDGAMVTVPPVDQAQRARSVLTQEPQPSVREVSQDVPPSAPKHESMPPAPKMEQSEESAVTPQGETQLRLFDTLPEVRPWTAVPSVMRPSIEAFLNWLDSQTERTLSDCGRIIVDAALLEEGRKQIRDTKSLNSFMRYFGGHPRVEWKANLFLVKVKDE